MAIGVIDEVISPRRTRRRLAEAFAAAPAGRGHHGNIPLLASRAVRYRVPRRAEREPEIHMTLAYFVHRADMSEDEATVTVNRLPSGLRAVGQFTPDL